MLGDTFFLIVRDMSAPSDLKIQIFRVYVEFCWETRLLKSTKEIRLEWMSYLEWAKYRRVFFYNTIEETVHSCILSGNVLSALPLQCLMLVK